MSQSIKLNDNTYVDTSGIYDSLFNAKQDYINATCAPRSIVGADMDTIDATCGYYINCTNAPTPYCMGFTIGDHESDAIQVMWSITANIMYFRRKMSNASWTGWMSYTFS